MKKFSKVLLGCVFGLSSIMFMTSVKADATHKWPVFQNGTSIGLADYLGNGIKTKCTLDVNNSYCKQYVITEDSGEDDEEVRLTSSDDNSDTFLYNKYNLSDGYVLSGTSEINECLRECGDGDPVEGNVTKVRYFLYDEFTSLLNNSQKYDNFVFETYYGANITIPKDVTLTVKDGLSLESVVNNGRIVTNALSVNGNLTGSGKVELYVKLPFLNIGDGPLSGTEVEQASRLFVKGNLTTGMINIMDVDNLENLPFGFVGLVDEYTKQQAEEMIKNYSNGLADNKYVIELKEQKIYGDGTYYYGLIKKASLTESTQKTIDTVSNKVVNAVKNPKTGDNIFYVIGMVVLAFGAIIMSIKKFARQR